MASVGAGTSRTDSGMTGSSLRLCSSTHNPAGTPNGISRPPLDKCHVSVTKAFQTPKLATAERALVRRRNMYGSENRLESVNTQFRAHPVNWRALASPAIGVKKVKPQSPTRPVPFVLKTAERELNHRRSDSDTDHQKNLAQQFKALRLPTSKPDPLPMKKIRQPTAVEPFSLRTNKMDAEFKEKRRKKEQEIEEKRRQEAQFHATLMPDFNKPVFCPALGEPRYTKPVEVKLLTDHRMEERKQVKKMKEEFIATVLRERELVHKEAEVEELKKMKQLREATVFHARPIKSTNKPFEIKHEQKFTVPQTPKFHLDRRLAERPSSRNGGDLERI